MSPNSEETRQKITRRGAHLTAPSPPECHSGQENGMAEQVIL